MTHGSYKSVNEIKAANAAAGSNWFEPETLAWWNCHVYPYVFAGRYFVTSEQDHLGGARVYSVRAADSSGKVSTVGEFGAYTSLADALAAANRAAEQE